MTPRCLICESLAVLPKENANTAVMLVGTIESVIRGMSGARTPAPDVKPEKRHESSVLQLLELIGNGVSAAIAGCSNLAAFAKDVEKYQFRHYDRLCLRCGALFNQSVCAETPGPTAISSASGVQPNAQPVPPPSADPRDPAASTTD